MVNILNIRSSYRKGETVSNDDMLQLYNAAKETYYQGEPILEDFEFDELESKLGLENKSYIGTKHNPSYTIAHPFIMGSLSKVQIHKDANGVIDWNKYFGEVTKYIKRNGNSSCIATPKFDGCSFEAQCFGAKMLNASSRGDGDWGADYSDHLRRFVTPNCVALNIPHNYVLRGEVLIDKKVFNEKYSDFVNPRSFVSGILNRDYSEDADFQSMLNDLSIVIYEIRVNENRNGYIDYDWFNFKYPDAPKYYFETDVNNEQELWSIYNTFAKYRDTCSFALDGIVIKPVQAYRENNLTEHRPKDCVAIKFIPMLEETEVIDIEWNLKKTGSLIPTVITRPVIMDGKSVSRCSGFNYQYLIDNKVSIGTKVVMSLAGDIIPFLYKITNTDSFSEDNLNLPTEYDYYVDGVNLKAALSNEEKTRLSFISSIDALNIPNLGHATAEDIWNYLNKDNGETDDFFGDEKKELPFNVLMCNSEDIYFGAGAGKAGKNAQKAFDDIVSNLSLKDIIRSCNFTACGDKVAEQVERFMLIGPDAADFTHLPEKAYSWIYNNDSVEYLKINTILKSIGKVVDDFKARAAEKIETISNQIPVILTGEPNDYKSKGEFLKLNPQYRNTTSWKEVKIVFTNDLKSTTGKMKKAHEKGIEIRLY